MEILKNLDEQRAKIVGGDVTLANDIAADGRDAIFAGIRTEAGAVTPEWEKLMSHYANNQKELDRLCGKDEDFNNSDWGLMSLAYIAANSTCTIDTTTTGGTLRNLTDPMKEALDKDF